MDANPFEELLIQVAKEIANQSLAQQWKPMLDWKILSILRSAFNPFSTKPQDKFQSNFNIQNILNPKKKYNDDSN